MLLAAGVGARPEAVVARAPCLRLWLRGAAGCCSARRGAAAAAAAAPGRSLQSALRCRPRPRGGWPAASGPLPEMLGHGRVPFSHVESLCCFSTAPLPENSEYGRLVYRGNLAKAVLGAKFVSYFASICSLCMMPTILFKTASGVDGHLLDIASGLIAGVFTIVIPVVLHLFTKGYIIRLYHKAETDTYTAITYNVILTEKKTVFHQKDVKVPDVSLMFTTFYAKTKSMLVNPLRFEYPQDYNHLMGYDKPFMFDLEEPNQPTKSK